MSLWNEVYARGQFRISNPDQYVTALVPVLRERGSRRVLDLACGAGRHLVYLARSGFEVYGTDIAGIALNQAREWLAREGWTAQLSQSEMSEMPFAGESFDAVICIHAIQHQLLQGLERTAAEIHRVLRIGGLVFATFPSRRDRRFGRGQEMETNTFISEEGPDAGVPHHYSNLAEIEKLFQGFVIRRVELEERLDEQGSRFSHLQVLAEKE